MANLSMTFEFNPLWQSAYNTLKDAILQGKLSAGTRIVETEYAARMHMSRTPLREALRELERDGLVEYETGRGAVVCSFSIDDVDEVYTIRNAMEMLTLPAIIQNATPKDIEGLRSILASMDAVSEQDIRQFALLGRRFHSELTALSGLPRVLRLMDGQDEFIARFSTFAIARTVDYRLSSQKEHYQILEHVADRDLDGLRQLVSHHAENSRQTCINALRASIEEK